MEKLAPRLEDYLETIYLLEKKNGVARVKEIALERNVRMSAVTEVLKKLSERGYVHYEPYGFVKTTEKGKIYAENLYRKHKTIIDFMKTVLQLPEEIAEKEGCLMEHHLSPETVERIRKLTKFFRQRRLQEEFKKEL